MSIIITFQLSNLYISPNERIKLITSVCQIAEMKVIIKSQAQLRSGFCLIISSKPSVQSLLDNLIYAFHSTFLIRFVKLLFLTIIIERFVPSTLL